MGITRSALAITGFAAFAAGCATTAPGYEAFQRGDYATACSAFEKEANNDSAESIGNLALCYERGLGGFPKDTNKAVSLWTRAARMGDPTARSTLARQGLPVPPADLVQQDQRPDPITSGGGY
jgi:TPR repeat protein